MGIDLISKAIDWHIYFKKSHRFSLIIVCIKVHFYLMIYMIQMRYNKIGIGI